MNPKYMAFGFFTAIAFAFVCLGIVAFLLSQGKIPGYSKELQRMALFKREVIDQTREHLIQEFNIPNSTEETRDYLKNVMFKDLTEDQFQQMMTRVKAEINAAKAVLNDGLSQQEAKLKFLSEWIEPEVLDDYPIYLNTQEKIEDAEKNIPKDLADSIEKSIPQQRKKFDDVKIASIVFSASEINYENFEGRRFRYELYLLNYAKDHRLDINPDWKEDDLGRLLEIETKWLE
ncbi:MAG: hypothetical protein P9L94_05265 [Candidatus Hinthialibacter antarcticus]|nr:hypothetical protein [Candidatus Hinthialibacter antarcticus]